MLYVADTHALFEVFLRQAFETQALPIREMRLGPGLVGALAASTPGAIWIGTYKEDGPGRLYRFATEVLSRARDPVTLTIADASAGPRHSELCPGSCLRPRRQIMGRAQS